MNPEPLPGQEILTEPFLRQWGAVEGMNILPHGGEWYPWPKSQITDEKRAMDHYLRTGCHFSAPLGTMAMVSTPLPEPVCKQIACDGSLHALSCPAHPNNRLVKVPPGRLAGLKVKPEGLMWATMECAQSWESFKYWPFDIVFGTESPGQFAYALPARVLAEIEGKEKEFQNPVLSAEPNDRDCVSADEPRHPRKHVGPNREFNSPDRDLSTQTSEEVKPCVAQNAVLGTSNPQPVPATSPTADEMLAFIQANCLTVIAYTRAKQEAELRA